MTRRTAISLVVCCGLALAYSVYAASFALGENLVKARGERARLEATLARMDGLQADADMLSARTGDIDAAFLTGATTAAANAAFQDHVQSLLTASGGEVARIKALAPKEEQGFQKITLELSLTAPLEALPALMHSFETARPAVFVEALDIRTQNVFQRNSVARADAPRQTQRLQIKVTAAGYAKGTPS